MPSVITGLGVVAGPGVGAESFWNKVSSGIPSASDYSTSIGDLSIESKACAAVDFNPDAYFEHRQQRLLDRVSQMAIVAAREAVHSAGLVISDEDPARIAIVIGTAVGGELSRETANHAVYVAKARVSPMTIPRVMASAASSAISIDLHTTGPTLTTSTACASSAHAIAVADSLVQSGVVDVAIAGGSETLPSIGLWKTWQGMGVLATDTIRPFSLERSGFVFGEGSGIVVLESEEHASRRRATPLCSLVGVGMSSDARDMVNPDQSGMAAAMSHSLSSAGLGPADISYVNAHGTGTKANDRTEGQALHEVFGRSISSLAVSSTKSVHGHAMGASSAIELVATIKAMQDGIAPPTANFVTPDPECDIDCVPNIARRMRIDAAMSNSFAFGGLNVSLVIRNAS